MKNLILVLLITLARTSFGNIINSSTDGNGRFEYVFENHRQAHDISEFSLPFGSVSGGIYDAESSLDWDISILPDEILFYTNDISEYLKPSEQKSFVLFSGYTDTTFYLHGIFGEEDRAGNYYIIDYQEIIAPIPEPTTLLLLGLGGLVVRRKR
ncbi:MAG: PEP-CTERM sorting domain-containing protein [Planctomycetes bacterium]|nr:PEP-CTERM sorting domain-containing protein [Planctomycetota bacterium]